jgi:hypothetical protein
MASPMTGGDFGLAEKRFNYSEYFYKIMNRTGKVKYEDGFEA